ncbi:glycosyltransferase [Candidatus Pelagibacter bacterium nBUS_32]|uniref:glycosyltransferase n=1 Tax=Candidatus Pelagibacter bacterium nBUS_32 TaxID=3374192 RepID=UPI003EBD44DB
MEKTLAIVVLTWNDSKNTIKCIKSIYPHLNNQTKLILVDNGSNALFYNKNLNFIEKNYRNNFLVLDKFKYKINKSVLSSKKIFILSNKSNLGCGYGHNTGYKFAIKNKFKFIARIDNDMIVPKKFFQNILKNFNNKNVLAVSPKIMYSKQRNQIWWMGTTIGNNLKIQRHLRNYPYRLADNKNINGIKETDAIAGCASIMRSSRLKKVGLSSADFFYGPEDVELSRRLYNKPGSLIVDRNVKIYHAVTQSFVGLNKRKIYFEYKYRLVLIYKIGTFFDKFFGYTVSIIKFIVYCILFSNPKHNFKIKPVFFALKHFFENKIGNFDRSERYIFK